jgi:metal-dependent amidase/aminoacylase/carboxypeptidase family protein
VLARRLRWALHRHPEVGHHEHRSARYVERLLRRLGLRPWRPAPTSVAAVVGLAGRRPVRGFRADLDALPLGCAAGPDHPDLHTPTFDFDEAVLLALVDVFDHLARAPRPTG